MMSYMTARLDKLENILLKLAEKVCESDKEAFTSISGISGDAVNDLNFESEAEDVSATESVSDPQDPSETKQEKQPNLEPLIKYGEIYLGSHSFFSILSKSSLGWMTEQLGEDGVHLIVPFMQLPAMFQKITKNLFKKWLGSPNLTHAEKFRILKSPFMQSKEFITRLFEKYAPSFSFAKVFFTQDNFLSFLDRYYDEGADRNMDINELFWATVLILFCLSRAIDYKLSNVETHSETDVSDEFSIKNLTALRDEYLSNCFYYAHQLSLLGTGLKCLQALLFLVIYMDTHVHAPEIIYLIFIQAVAKGRDLGLHRIESYNNFEDPTTQLRLSLWYLLGHIDMEICFRSGRTPLLNYSDVSPEIKERFHYSSPCFGSTTAESHEWHSRLFDIRLESYNRLFSASANIHSFEVLSSNLDFFNSEMANLGQSMHGDRRPLFFNEPGFTQIYCIENDSQELRARSLLTFFAHIMLINRIPSMHQFPEIYNEKCKVYQNLSLNSARTILYLLKDFDHRQQGPFPLWMFYLPVSAILHLSAVCMVDPGTPDAESDIRLIAETCKRHFNRLNPRNKFVSSQFEISFLLEVLVKSMLQVVIRIYETRTGRTCLPDDPAFLDSLQSFKKHFPRLFKTPKDLESSLGSHFQGKSPFAALNKGSSSCTSPSSKSDLSNSGRPSSTDVPEFTVDTKDILDQAYFLSQFDEVDFFLQSQNETNPNFFTNASGL